MASASVEMILGNDVIDANNYSFSPVPVINMTLENIHNDDGSCICKTYNAILTGTLVKNNTEDLFTQKQNLEDAIACGEDCQRLRLICIDDEENETILLDIFPRIQSINFAEGNNNWCYSIPYTIEIIWSESGVIDDLETAECVSNTTDSWSFEVSEDPMKITVITGDPPEPCEPYIETEGDYEFTYVPDELNDFVGYEYQNAEVTCPEPETKDLYYIKVKITHELSATGVAACVYDLTDPEDPESIDLSSITRIPGWERAKLWVDNRLATSGADFADTDPMVKETISKAGFPCNYTGPLDIQYLKRNYTISKNLNKEAGTYGATESWDVIIFDGQFDPPTDPGTLNDLFQASEDYTIDINSGCSGEPTKISINGTITGLGDYDICPFNVSYSKMESAQYYWNKVQDILYCRVSDFYTGGCKLHPKPIQFLTAINEKNGTIGYTVEYDDRPLSFIPGSCLERISFTDILPAQSIIEQPVLGRKRGPVLQNLNTTNARCKTMNMEIIMERLDFNICSGEGHEDGCIVNCAGLGYTSRDPGGQLIITSPKIHVDKFVCCQQLELQQIYTAVYRVEDSETWDPISRRYTRTVRWCFEDCESPEINNFICVETPVI